MKNQIVSASILGVAVLAMAFAHVAQAQPIITNAPGYLITWDGNNGDNPASPNAPPNIASATQGGVAYASGQLGPEIGAAFHYVTNLNDGFYGNTNSWIGGTNDPTPLFAGIQLSNTVALTGIAWGRDNSGALQDRCLGTYTLQVSTNASFTTNAADWITLGTITYTNSTAGFSPWLRHRYQLGTTAGGQIMATGVRLLVPSSGLATGTDIDELELFRSSVTNIAYWRMGENDPGAANGVTNFVTVNLLGDPMALRSNAVYTSSVASTAAAPANSTLALQFTTGRYATNQPAFAFTDNFGLELWVKPDATNATQCIAYNGDSGPNGWGLYLHQGKYQGLIGGQAFLPGPDAVPGVWTHLALVRNNGLTTLYVNGVPSTSSALPPNPPTGRFALAAQAQALTAEFFAGALDEVRVFGFAPGTFSTGDLLLSVLPPTVTTTAATSIAGASATLNGTVRPQNLPTAVWFEWGTTTNYGNFTATNLLAATNGVLAVSNNLTGLVAGTTYHYRLAASNALGFSYGADQAFTIDAFSPVSLPGVPATDGDVAWGDYDNDGRLDFLIVSSSSSQLWRNTGNGFTNVPVPGLPGGGFKARMAWGDFNNDGNLDFFLTGNNLAQIWQNNGDNTFSNVTASLAPGLAGGFQYNVAWGDYDNDGRLDFLLTGREPGYKTQLWRNTGQGFTNVTASVAPGVPGLTSSCLAWADYDNDGRLDFIIAGQYTPDSVNIPNVPVLQLWHNTGNGFELAPPLPVPRLSSSPQLAWGDFDNDGHLDLAYTGNVNIPVYLCRNTGTGFQLAVALPSSDKASDRVTATWGDYDNDGRLDLLVLSLIITPDFSTTPSAQLWRNTTNGFVTVPFSSSISSVPSKGVWGDYDNDGRLDLIWVGDVDSPSIQLWRNYTPVTNTPPSAPTGLAMTATTNAVMLSWNSATDGQTPATGLTYNVRAGSTPGGIDLFAGHVTATNGFRRVPDMGNAYLRHSLPLTGLTNGQTVYWSVQAVDTAFAGGPFATETSVVTIPTLSISKSSATNALVSWTPPTWGWFLQESTNLATGNWSNAPSGELNPATIPGTNSAKFFRLKNQ